MYNSKPHQEHDLGRLHQHMLDTRRMLLRLVAIVRGGCILEIDGLRLIGGFISEQPIELVLVRQHRQ